MCVIAHVLGVTRADAPGLWWSRPVWWGRNAETVQGCSCFWTDIFSSQFHLGHDARLMTDHSAINLNVQQCKHPSVSGEQAISPISTAKIILSWNADVNPSNHCSSKTAWTGWRSPTEDAHIERFSLSKQTRWNLEKHKEKMHVSNTMAWNRMKLGTVWLCRSSSSKG